MGLRFYNQTWFFSPLLSPVQSLLFGRAQSPFPLLYSNKPAHFLWSTALPPILVVLLGQDWLPSAAGAGPGGLQPINEAPQPQELVYKWAHDPVQVSETQDAGEFWERAPLRSQDLPAELCSPTPGLKEAARVALGMLTAILWGQRGQR